MIYIHTYLYNYETNVCGAYRINTLSICGYVCILYMFWMRCIAIYFLTSEIGASRDWTIDLKIYFFINHCTFSYHNKCLELISTIWDLGANIRNVLRYIFNGSVVRVSDTASCGHIQKANHPLHIYAHCISACQPNFGYIPTGCNAESR